MWVQGLGVAVRPPPSRRQLMGSPLSHPCCSHLPASHLSICVPLAPFPLMLLQGKASGCGDSWLAGVVLWGCGFPARPASSAAPALCFQALSGHQRFAGLLGV